MRALVIGAGISGLGCARLLNHESYAVTLATNCDFSSRLELESQGVKVVLDDKDMSLVQPYDLVVKSPGIPNSHPLVSAFDCVLDEIEVAWRLRNDLSFYAISGTNGKTTTVSLLHHMLKKKNGNALLAGNVGISLSESIINLKEPVDIALEISAFQMEGTPSFAPDVYGVLNLSPDHLDRFENATDYYKAKLDILPRVGTFIRNCDDTTIVELTQNYVGKVVNVSLKSSEEMDVYRKGNTIYYKHEMLFDINSLRIVGDHNLMNAIFASVSALIAGVSISDVRQSLAEFAGVEHRCEFVRTLSGVDYYNDSKATNPESTEVCLKSFKQPTILLAGGYDKKISFNILKPFAKTLKKVYLFGECAPQLNKIFPEAVLTETMEQALFLAHKSSELGDVVVLSPACASYDQFKNFEERGEIFKSLVNLLN